MSYKKTALITGITGQDGSYLAEQLLAAGYKVVGTTRKKIISPEFLGGKVDFVGWDLKDSAKIEEIIGIFRPSEIYNFAALTSGATMFENPVELCNINGVAVVRILEAICSIDKSIRFCQASSREVFGEPNESPQSELTRPNPRNPYGAAKSYADSMVKIYRREHGLFACSAILFNHESPRRGMNFVTRKITHTAAKIKLGLDEKLNLGNLESKRDWGFAGDYVRAMTLMLQDSDASDYVIATGEAHTVRDFCKAAFDFLGLNYLNYVALDDNVFRPSEVYPLIGDSREAKSRLNWKATVNFNDLVAMMVESDLNLIKSGK